MNYTQGVSDPFHTVEKFENVISDFYGAKYGVATDCCTHAIELCLRYEGYDHITIPERTYVSVPMTCMKLGIDWSFNNFYWSDSYYLGGTNIIDGAVLWRKNSYTSGTYLCLSFQYRKHLSLGRGGMILTDDKDSAEVLRMMTYDGRKKYIPWGEQNISTIGYHYYMTPETAEMGLEVFSQVNDAFPIAKTSDDYPYLTNMRVFK
jgi:dTDP-4-amino-4,6-dideoxygalactose transaminase